MTLDRTGSYENKQHEKTTTTQTPELSMGPFCVTRSNPTHQLTDPTQPTTSGKIWTQPQKTNNGAYSLIVTYFYTKNLSGTVSQPSINLFTFLYILKTVSLCHSKTSSSLNCLKCPQQQLSKPARRPHRTSSAASTFDADGL